MKLQSNQMSTATTRKTNLWPLLVIAIGAAFLAVTVWSIQQAGQKLSPVTDHDYYRHGLRYNQTTIERKAAESAGWVMHSGISGRRLTIVLENGQHEPVTGCRGQLIIYDGGTNQPSRRMALTISEAPAGSYNIAMPADLAGTLTGDLSLYRNGAVFNRRVLINL